MIFQFQHAPDSSLAGACLDLRQLKTLLSGKQCQLICLTWQSQGAPPSPMLYPVLGVLCSVLSPWWVSVGTRRVSSAHPVQRLGEGCFISRDCDVVHSRTSSKTSELRGSVLFSSYITDSTETVVKCLSNWQIKWSLWGSNYLGLKIGDISRKEVSGLEQWLNMWW